MLSMFACSTFDPEVGGNFSEFLRNLGIFLPDYTVLYTRKQYVPFVDTAVGAPDLTRYVPGFAKTWLM
jgi:hypothetical protein